MIHFVPKSFQKALKIDFLREAVRQKKPSFAHTAKWIEKEEAYLFQIAFPVTSKIFKTKIHKDAIVLYNQYEHTKYKLPKGILKDQIEFQQTETHINCYIPKENNWRKLLLEDLNRIDDAYVIEDNGKMSIKYRIELFFQKIKSKLISLV